MSSLLDYLKMFNSKERFFLVGQILGKSRFSPSKKFRGELNKVLGLEIPTKVFAAMDYHLDWLYASLELARGCKEKYIHKNGNQKADKKIKGQQEDIDFLIAFNENDDEKKPTHIVLIEAKGVTAWSNKQMDSKVKRLNEIFGKKGTDTQRLFHILFLCHFPG